MQGWEYVGVNLRPGVNRIQVEQLDGMGNARGSASVSVIAPGKLARIELSAPERPMADGRTPARLRLRLTDRDGVPVTARTQVTLNATIGQWQLEDLSPAEPGTQIFVEGGQAELPLTPPASPGEGHVEVQAGNLRKKIPLVFVPELRPMIAAGIVEGSISLNQIDFSKMEPVRSGDVFERELRAHSRSFNGGKGSAGGRAAFFLKGKIRGDYLLTAAYDSEKDHPRPPVPRYPARRVLPSTATRRSAASTRKAPAACMCASTRTSRTCCMATTPPPRPTRCARSRNTRARSMASKAITRRTSRVARWK